MDIDKLRTVEDFQSWFREKVEPFGDRCRAEFEALSPAEQLATIDSVLADKHAPLGWLMREAVLIIREGVAKRCASEPSDPR